MRLDALTGLRWWAAFAVFVHHLGNFVVYPAPLAAFTVLGVHGVTFFFVLSGFVLTWSSGRAMPGATVPDARTFWWRRFARIYPAHLVALLLAIPVFTTLVVGPDTGNWWVRATSLGVLALSVVLLQGWSRDPSVLFSGNPAAWTLTCEAFFYAFHPFADRGLARCGRRATLVAAGGIVVLLVGLRAVVLLGGPVGGVVGGLPWPVLRATEFLLGMACARALALGWRPRLRVGAVVAGIAVVGGWLALTPWWLTSGPGASGAGEPASALARLAAPVWFASSMQEVMTVGTAMLVVAVAVRALEGRPTVLERRRAVVLGEWSYAFYLVHATVIYVMLDLVGRQRGLLGVACGLLALAGSLAAAWALHAWVERPAERRLRGAWDARRARPTVRAR